MGFKVMQIEVSNFCSLACWYCPHPQQKRANGDMSLTTFRKCLELVNRSDNPIRNGSKLVWLNHFGEPLLNPLLADFISEARNRAVNVSFASNGVDENKEFIELYDGGAGNTPLDGLVVVLFNGSDDSSYGAFDLDGFSTNSLGFFVIGDADTQNVDFTPNGFDAVETPSPGSDLQNGEDAVALYVADADDFPNDTPATTKNLQDAIVYETGSDIDSALPVDLGTEGVVDENGVGDEGDASVARTFGGASFTAMIPTPGSINGDTPATAGCDPSFGDLDGDGFVGFVDFLVLSKHFGTKDANPSEGDVNCDEAVDMTDVMTLWYDIADYPSVGAYEVNCCE